MKVLALAGYDSFLNTARLISLAFEDQGSQVDFALVKARKKKQISPEQIAEMGIKGSISEIDLVKFCQKSSFAEYDIILACLEGLSSRRLFEFLPENEINRPLIISIYPGLVLRYMYDGLAARAPADFLWLNCRRDFEAYEKMCDGFALAPSNARLFGNGSLLEKIEREETALQDGPVVFFEQAIIPRYYHERRFLVEKLFDLAQRYPKKQFLIKARVTGKKATLHQTWHAIDCLFEKESKRRRYQIKNIKLTQENTPKLLSKASYCLTISSTVAAEAIHAQVPTAILNDFGAHDDYGLQYFYGSGILRSFEKLDLEEFPQPAPKWLDDYLFDPAKSINTLVAEAIGKAQSKGEVTNKKRKTAMQSCAFFLYLTKFMSPNAIASRAFQKREGYFSHMIRAFKANRANNSNLHR